MNKPIVTTNGGKVKRLILAAAVALAVSPVHAQDQVFGLEFGKALSLPECAYSTVTSQKLDSHGNYGKEKLYSFKTAQTCVMDVQPIRRVLFSEAETPSIVKNSAAYPLEIDGVVVGVHFFTNGVSTEELVIQALTAKYGRPTAVDKKTVQNRMGAKYTAVVSASWNLPSLTVDYVLGDLSTGQVYIDTPQATKFREQRSNQEHASERKL